VRRIPIFFAEERVRRPSAPGWRCSRKRCVVRPCRWDLRDLRKQIAALCPVGLLASRERVVRGATQAPRNLAGRESRVCAAGSLRPIAPAGLDGRSCGVGVSSRCRRGSVTRGVRADRVGAKLPSSGLAFGQGQRIMKTDATHDERRRAAQAGRPLARETSADVGWKALESRKAREGWKRRRHPDSAVDVADGAPTPSGGLPPSPARAGRDPSTGANRGSGGRAVVLVDCSGCRSRREASGPSRSPRWVTSVEGVGSSPPASCSGGKRASEAGSRRQSRENGGGLSTIPEEAQASVRGREHSSREGVLVRRSGRL